MKKLLFIFVALMITSLCYAQEKKTKDIPPPVSAALLAEYPGVTEIRWKMDSINRVDYVAIFKYDRIKYFVQIQTNGTIVKTDRNIPIEVSDAIKRTYPTANNVRWKMDTINVMNYLAIFRLEKIKYIIELQPIGNIVKTDYDIDVSIVPKVILDYIKANYPNVKIKGSRRTDIILDSKGAILYTVQLEKKGIPLVFDANGNLVQ